MPLPRRIGLRKAQCPGLPMHTVRRSPGIGQTSDETAQMSAGEIQKSGGRWTPKLTLNASPSPLKTISRTWLAVNVRQPAGRGILTSSDNCQGDGGTADRISKSHSGTKIGLSAPENISVRDARMKLSSRGLSAWLIACSEGGCVWVADEGWELEWGESTALI